MKKLIFLSFIIFISFFTLNSQTATSLGITGTYFDIRSDNSNTVHILWIDNGWAKYGQIVNRQVVNQVTIPVTDRNEVVTDKFRPRLSVKPDGSEVHFVWVTPDIQSRDLMHAWKDSGGTWRKEKIFTSSRYVEYPTFTVDSSGVYHAACIEWVSANLLINIAYYRKPSGGSWTRMTDLAPRTAEHKWPNLFTDTNGNVHITWDKNKDYIQYRSTSSGGDLSASSTTTLPILHTGNKQAEVFADASGNVHVAALSYNAPGSAGGIDYWVKPAGGSFSSPIQVTGGDFSLMYYFPHPAVIARSTDMVAVSWVEEPRSPAKVRVSIYDGGWTVYTLSTTANVKDDTRTTMAMDDNSAYMVWRESDGSLWLATFDYAIFGVISPNGGEEWAYGQTYQIRWDLENATGDVDINLYKNNIDLGPIASDVADTGSFNWTINTLESGANISDGNDYQIEVKAINGSDSDISNSNFTITTVFKLTSPTSSSIWTAGQNYNITWTTPSEASSGVKINIFKGSIDVANFVEQLTGPNNGLYSWTIPGSYEEGIYRLRLKTDDDLMIDDSDEFYIEVDPNAPPSITVTSPAFGDIWYNESSYNILWTSTGIVGNVAIHLYLGSVAPENQVAQLAVSTENDGSYPWTVPGTLASGNYIVSIEATDPDSSARDDSDLFSITYNPNLPPSMTFTSPVSGTTWLTNNTYDITWNRTGALYPNVKINIFKDSISVENYIGQLTGPNTGSYSWTIPGTYADGNYLLRIKTDDGLVKDDSDLFSILNDPNAPATITVNDPGAGVTWYKGSSYNITWTGTGTQTTNVNIEVYRDSVSAGNLTDQINTANDGSYNWTVPASYIEENYIIRIETTDAATNGDSGLFNIAENSNLPPSMTITSPTSSDTWYKGSTYNITWNKTGTLSANVKINVFKDSISVANYIGQMTGPNTGSYSWTIPDAYTDGNYLLRIKTDDDLVKDDSDLFSIITDPNVPATITVNDPGAGITWYKGSSYNITWTGTGTQTTNVYIDIYENSVDPSNFVEQINTANDGSYNWTVPTVYAEGNYIIRIETTDAATNGDSGLFNIAENSNLPPSMTITSPTSSSVWNQGNTYDITWDRTGTLSANVKINIFKDSISVANYVGQLTGPNTGSYSWTIPDAYTDGNYLLRIKTDDDLVKDDSELFQITTGGSVTPKITVISPSSCSSWSKNNVYTITWLKDGSMSANVTINIFRDSIDESNLVEQLTGPNSGSIEWPIPDYYENGNYILRVKTDDDQVMDDSELFAVNSDIINPPKITVTSPTSCDTWRKLKTYRITWSKTGTMSADVKVNIFRDSIAVANYIGQLTGPNTGSIEWTIPGNYANGNYVLRVKTVDDAVLGDSNVFVVTD